MTLPYLLLLKLKVNPRKSRLSPLPRFALRVFSLLIFSPCQPSRVLRTHSSIRRLLVAREYHEVVGIAHQTGFRPGAWAVRTVKLFVKPVQVQVRQQWRNHSSLGRSLTIRRCGWLVAFVSLYYWRSQPLTQESWDTAIAHAHSHTGH